MRRIFLALALSVAGIASADLVIEQPNPVPPAPAAAAEHPGGNENAPRMGVIEGGWGYVYACYAIAIGGTALYALSLFLRRPTGSNPGAQS